MKCLACCLVTQSSAIYSDFTEICLCKVERFFNHPRMLTVPWSKRNKLYFKQITGKVPSLIILKILSISSHLLFLQTFIESSGPWLAADPILSRIYYFFFDSSALKQSVKIVLWGNFCLISLSSKEGGSSMSLFLPFLLHSPFPAHFKTMCLTQFFWLQCNSESQAVTKLLGNCPSH